jgi:hypothetical protein
MFLDQEFFVSYNERRLTYKGSMCGLQLMTVSGRGVVYTATLNNSFTITTLRLVVNLRVIECVGRTGIGGQVRGGSRDGCLFFYVSWGEVPLFIPKIQI